MSDLPARSDELPPLNEAMTKLVTAKLVREYVRATIVEPVLRRLYDIGMGVTTFEVATMAGRTVTVPAPSSVQVKALTALAAIGVPGQVGLVDDAGNVLPGIFALPPMQLDEARRAVSGSLYNGNGNGNDSATLPPMSERIAAGEFEIVEVEEGVGSTSPSDDQPPAEVPPSLTLEQQILAKRRARNGNGNGGS